ncbi:MAG TPA: RNA polymerase sigma factor [Ardenticatenaceae bacterium]|nr:RNA polymerase sigma factor [Ardenticatenaceae bacterium]
MLSTDRPNAETSLQHILAAERPRLLRLCTALTGDPDAAEDVVQEVSIEAWRHAGQLRNPDAVGAWLSGIARNVAARWWRARGRQPTTLDQPLEDLTFALPAGDDFDLEMAVERDELATLLDRALALLPPEMCDLLVRSYLRESPHAAIAEQLGISANAVAVRLHRGKLALRRLLSNDLRDELAPFGLLPAGDGWNETRIWCTSCGRHRLLGCLSPAEFLLRCPGCAVEPNAYYAQSHITPLLDGVKSFRPALTRLERFMHDLFRTALAGGSVACQRCGRPALLRMGMPDYAPPSLRRQRGAHVRCLACGSSSYSTLDGMMLNLPEGRRFFRRHPRIRTLPQREIEAGGVPALVTHFESVTGSATFDVVVARDSYAVLQIHGDTDA